MPLVEPGKATPSWAPLDPTRPEDFDGLTVEPATGTDHLLRFVPQMGTCPACGNGLVREDGECRLCETDVRALLFDSIETLDISRVQEEDQPRKMLRALDRARARKKPLIRVAHGIGRGSTLRTLCWYLMDRGDLKNWVIGEVMGDTVEVGKGFVAGYPVLRWSSDWNAGNDAVTWVEVG